VCSKHVMVSKMFHLSFIVFVMLSILKIEMWRGLLIMIPGPLSMLLLVICNSVKMGIRLCYKWDEPK
jgi:hypothetical protein